MTLAGFMPSITEPTVTAELRLNTMLLTKNNTISSVSADWYILLDCWLLFEENVRLAGEKAYLSVSLDLKGRDIVSFSIGKSSNNRLVFKTFDLAVEKYPDAHPLFHSDRGFRYTSKQFKAKLDKQGMKQSVSLVGRCIDNGLWRASGHSEV